MILSDGLHTVIVDEVVLVYIRGIGIWVEYHTVFHHFGIIGNILRDEFRFTSWQRGRMFVLLVL
jgi:hypothetical protein